MSLEPGGNLGATYARQRERQVQSCVGIILCLCNSKETSECSSSGVDEVRAEHEGRETVELIKLVAEMLVSTCTPSD